jgi:adenine-specific DNA methylase
MIERWFPCKEVSENSTAGWGSGNTERALFTWFAARPTAQAKAAVICSLLPWPDDTAEQKRLQELVKTAMTGRYAAWDQLRAEILKANPEGASVLDPFSGRGMIPLEAARLGLESHAIEYAPVAVVASHLLTDYPFRDWTNEPELPFARPRQRHGTLDLGGKEAPADRYYRDVEAVLAEVGRRHATSMAEFYPAVGGKQPWGYLWAVTLPCQECGRRFPLVGSYNLRLPSEKKATKSRAKYSDPGQSFYIEVDPAAGTLHVVVHDGAPRRTPTLANAVVGGRKVRGKSATCTFCAHVHPLETHKRLAQEGLGRDALLVVADHDDLVGKDFRTPRAVETEAALAASAALLQEPRFSPVLPAVPDEEIPLNSGATIRPQLYGAHTYGDLMVDRQTLSFVRLAKIIDELSEELKAGGTSDDYARALAAKYKGRQS